MKCRAQAISMMGPSQSALRLLLRMQAAREKRESSNEACDRAAWTEDCALGLMTEALSPPPQTPSSRGRGQGEGAALTAAEQYAAIYPQRAALIRRMGRVPENITFDPPDNDLVQALIAGEATAPAVSPHDPSSHDPRNETALRTTSMAAAE